MEILFLIPPVELNSKKTSIDRVYGCNYGFDYKPPIHLLVLATIAKQSGHSVRLLDCPAEGYNLSKLTGYIKNKSSIDMAVFFTVWLSENEDLAAAKIIHDVFNNVKIIFTGPYPTWKPELFLKNNDYLVIRGEPEGTFIEIIKNSELGKNIFYKVNGLSFLDGNNIVNNMSRELIDINKIPVPDRSLLKGHYVFNRINEYPATIMCVSRGCSYKCTYCAPHALDQAIELEYMKTYSDKPPLRLQTKERVISEFKEIASLGYKGVEICDNQFIWDEARTKEICNAIQYLKLSWICYARADRLKDKEALSSMHRAGCKLIYIGTESFNQVILDDVNKEMRVKNIYKAVELLRECNIDPEVSVLLGASGLETEGTIQHSIREARRLKTNFIHYSIASPLPNTHLYKIAKEKGWIKTQEFRPIDNIRDALLDLPYIKAERLKTITRRCYVRQYLSLHFITRQVLSPRFFKIFVFKLKVLGKLIKYIIF